MDNQTTYKYQILLNQDKIPIILDSLGIEYKYGNGVYSFPCPIHNGDNNGACTIFEGKHGVPNWRCWTQQCHETYGKGIYGFIKGVLSQKLDKDATGYDITNFLKGNNIQSEKIKIDTEKVQWKKLINTLNIGSDKQTRNIDRKYIRSNLVIPSPYFLSRGISKEILDEFDVGDCKQEGKMMFERAVCPVYDFDGSYAGVAGRTTVGHPDKWIYSFAKGNFLYGLNLAIPTIREKKTIILVEGNGDVLKLFQLGFRNTVAIMGTAFTDQQLVLLEKLGIFDVIIMTDMDEAGRNTAKIIREKCGRRFNLYTPEYSGKDPDECPEDELRKILC